mgnify:CR=1 FL=1
MPDSHANISMYPSIYTSIYTHASTHITAHTQHSISFSNRMQNATTGTYVLVFLYYTTLVTMTFLSHFRCGNFNHSNAGCENIRFTYFKRANRRHIALYRGPNASIPVSGALGSRWIVASLCSCISGMDMLPAVTDKCTGHGLKGQQSMRPV